MNRSFFPRDLFAEMDRLQRDMQQALDPTSSIRGLGRGFPALNVGGTPESLEIYAFAPGLDPDALEVNLDRGILTIAGQRSPSFSEDAAVHINERFDGHFRRVVALSEDADPDKLQATYRDGVLRITVQRRAASQPRRIDIQ
ncbi:Hsp20/alpha crystallin family protein [Variovorax sp. OV329]|uniref:Hsp20/alpha crystallin family protein n=1 Tax=Variovorax sp. OV329 TaxID=1882825 RepID=UPI0008EAB561|nr:Hsp20/alpha crystallin family protein [Variovorax sp. OV329]SFN22045.1 HSP20 family protein [Variovorax sp. OV329]